jgi:sulfate permease, SulP family
VAGRAAGPGELRGAWLVAVAVDAVRKEITRRGAVFALGRVKQDLLARLRAFGLAGKIGEDLFFPTLPTAVNAYRQWVKQHDRPPGSDTAATS